MLSESELVIRTPRLVLRPLEPDDAEAIWPHAADPEVSRYMAWAPHEDITRTRSFVQAEILRTQERRGATWAIISQGQFCGIISLISLVRRHRDLTYDKAELAYWLGRAHQGQGIMAEAARHVMAFAFNGLDLHKLWVGHFGPNDASRRLIERLGFRFVGTQEQEFCKDGIWYDHLLYEVLADEWRAGTLGERRP